MSAASLRHQAISGLIWSAFERFGQQGCAFFVQHVLARLLASEQFGLIAMVVVFISISSATVSSAFGRFPQLVALFLFLDVCLLSKRLWLARGCESRFFNN